MARREGACSHPLADRTIINSRVVWRRHLRPWEMTATLSSAEQGPTERDE